MARARQRRACRAPCHSRDAVAGTARGRGPPHSPPGLQPNPWCRCQFSGHYQHQQQHHHQQWQDQRHQQQRRAGPADLLSESAYNPFLPNLKGLLLSLKSIACTRPPPRLGTGDSGVFVKPAKDPSSALITLLYYCTSCEPWLAGGAAFRGSPLAQSFKTGEKLAAAESMATSHSPATTVVGADTPFVPCHKGTCIDRGECTRLCFERPASTVRPVYCTVRV